MVAAIWAVCMRDNWVVGAFAHNMGLLSFYDIKSRLSPQTAHPKQAHFSCYLHTSQCALSMQNMFARPKHWNLLKCWHLGLLCVAQRLFCAHFGRKKWNLKVDSNEQRSRTSASFTSLIDSLMSNFAQGAQGGCRGGGTFCTLQALMEGFALFASDWSKPPAFSTQGCV